MYKRKSPEQSLVTGNTVSAVTKQRKLCTLRQELRAYEDDWLASRARTGEQQADAIPTAIPTDAGEATVDLDSVHSLLDRMARGEREQMLVRREGDQRDIQVKMCAALVQKVDLLGIHDITRIIRCVYGRPPHKASQSNTSLPRPSMPFLCPSCQAHRTYNSVESQLSCPRCGVSVYYPDGTEGRHSQAVHSGTNSGTSSTQNVGYDRAQLYRKHLEQYTGNGMLVPENVLDVVKLALHNIHVMRPSKCRPTTIVKILKDRGLPQWCKHAVRICRHICGRSSGELPSYLVEKLMARFHILVRVYNKENAQRSKFLNFDFLTKQFLHMEGLGDVATLFQFQKTKEVELRAESRLSGLCELAAKETGDASWKVFVADSTTPGRRAVTARVR